VERIGKSMQLQAETNFLVCDCGGGSFYIGLNGVEKENVAYICCTKCKEACARFTVQGGKLSFDETEFASEVGKCHGLFINLLDENGIFYTKKV
jgi:hypothetical protein